MECAANRKSFGPNAICKSESDVKDERRKAKKEEKEEEDQKKGVSQYRRIYM